MTFLESVLTCLTQKFVSIEGRASRSEYWWFFLFSIVLGWCLNTIPGSLVSLCLFIASITVSVRRCHDLGKSGWLVVIPYVLITLCVVLCIYGLFGQNQTVLFIGYIFIALSVISSLALFIYFMFPGTQGPNKYGDGPYIFEYSKKTKDAS